MFFFQGPRRFYQWRYTSQQMLTNSWEKGKDQESHWPQKIINLILHSVVCKYCKLHLHWYSIQWCLFMLHLDQLLLIFPSTGLHIAHGCQCPGLPLTGSVSFIAALCQDMVLPAAFKLDNCQGYFFCKPEVASLFGIPCPLACLWVCPVLHWHLVYLLCSFIIVLYIYMEWTLLWQNKGPTHLRALLPKIPCVCSLWLSPSVRWNLLLIPRVFIASRIKGNS